MSLFTLLTLSVIVPRLANDMANKRDENIQWQIEEYVKNHIQEEMSRKGKPHGILSDAAEEIMSSSYSPSNKGDPLAGLDPQQLMKQWMDAPSSATQAEHIYSDPRYAGDILWELGIQLRHRKHFLAMAEWNYETNITDGNYEKLEAEQSRFTEWSDRKVKEVRKFRPEAMPEMLNRQIRMVSSSIITSDNASLSEEILRLKSYMTTSYSSAKACLSSSNVCVPLKPDLERLMAQSNDPELLKEAWLKWRQASGQPMKEDYTRLVDLLNSVAQENGFHDHSQYEMQQAFFETPNLETMMDRLWEAVEPLYKQLHAYVRRRLRNVYGKSVVGDDGTLPAHLMGNMWSQNWIEIFHVVAPYPEVNVYREVEAILSSVSDVQWMFRLAEDFYRSLGLSSMTKAFWEKSMFRKPTDRKVTCHAKSYDMFSQGDFRIKMCAKLTFHDLLTVFHEMGHVTYCMAYATQPTVFRTGASLATHEAVGDMVEMSLLSPARLKAVGLLQKDLDQRKDSKTEITEQDGKQTESESRAGYSENSGERSEEVSDGEKRSINQLMFLALKNIAFLPFGYLVDKWRYGVIRGLIQPEEYNKKWWELRLRYQGVRSPVPRNESDFDPGAKYHILDNSMFSGYFLSHIQQFQMFSSLCQEAGQNYPPTYNLNTILQNSERHHVPQQDSSQQRPLHKCDLYGSKKAGYKLRQFLSYGSSIPWQKQLLELTGEPTIQADALLTYFRPLQDWLEKENNRHRETIGWEGAEINWMD